jgi:hypothetical protein
MRQNLTESIEAAYPTAIVNEDYRIHFENGEVYIHEWNEAKLGPKPNEDELIAAQASAVITAEQNQKIHDLWQAGTDYVEAQMSTDDKIAYNFWMLLNVSQAAKDKILANFVWVNTVWDLYYKKKENIKNGIETDYDFSDAGNVDFTFAQVKASI